MTASPEMRLGIDQPFFADGGRLFESHEAGFIRPGQELQPGQTRLVAIVDSEGKRVVCEEWIPAPGEAEAWLSQQRKPTQAPSTAAYTPAPQPVAPQAPVEFLNIQEEIDVTDDEGFFGLRNRPSDSQTEATPDSQEAKKRRPRSRRHRVGRAAVTATCLGVMFGPYTVLTAGDGINSPVDFVRDVGDFGGGIKDTYDMLKSVAEFVS